MKMLMCPKCGGELQTIIYEDIEVDRCCQCAGIWFDSSEAEELKRRKGSENIDIGKLNWENHQEALDAQIPCPRCGISMIKMLDLDKHPIWYETCSQCQGIWFDAGEFKKYKDNFPKQGLLSKAIKAFRLKK
ncbi:zf-TFIIB domain-containing protein [Crocosphaera sp. XPORK-15E]|uniref:zf-TFIIB domain-containing protein n=1 Tax=Crocosphaera sp. XPORK-15E TaxID=3110247 RepID=UPI002B2102B2|nr:zf-TFIIB domain-containing protein [Crocosphaera sp. XPORK-15E]MEA5535886.1 zf-TFIIB domain-containing protein [Crocosphaera sp. XPORK-15E]